MYLNILYFNIVVPIVKGRPQLGYDFWRWRWRHIATTHWRWSRPLWRHIATTRSLTTHYPLTTHCDDALSDEALAFDDALRLWAKTYDGTSCDVCFLQLPQGVGCFLAFWTPMVCTKIRLWTMTFVDWMLHGSILLQTAPRWYTSMTIVYPETWWRLDGNFCRIVFSTGTAEDPEILPNTPPPILSK